MAHGLPDESNVKSGIPLYLTTDLGELAVRLGSPVIYHRQGAVLYMEAFDKGYRRCAFETGLPSGSYEITSEYWESKGVSLKMASEPDASSYIGLLKRLPCLYLGYYATHSLLAYTSTCYRMTLTYAYFDGTNQHLFEIRITPNIGKAEYRDVNGAYQEITTELSFLSFYRIFNYHRLKVNLDSLTYESFTFNQTEYSIAGLACYPIPSGLQRHLVIGIETEGSIANRGIVYVDSIILTQEEP